MAPMRGIVTGIGLFGLLAASAGTAQAQAAATSFGELTGKLKTNATVSVTDDSGRKVQGKLVDLTPSTVTILEKGAAGTFERRTYEQTAVQQLNAVRGSAGKGAKAGLGIGAAIGLIAGLAGCGDCGDQTLGFAIGAAIGFGGIGAGVGAMVGSSIPREQLLYRAPLPPATAAFALRPFVSAQGTGVAATLRF